MNTEEAVSVCQPDPVAAEKSWKAFALWWAPRHDGCEPLRGEPVADMAFEYYCAGVLDEKTRSSLPNQVMKETFRLIQKTLDEAGQVLEAHERDSA